MTATGLRRPEALSARGNDRRNTSSASTGCPPLYLVVGVLRFAIEQFECRGEVGPEDALEHRLVCDRRLPGREVVPRATQIIREKFSRSAQHRRLTTQFRTGFLVIEKGDHQCGGLRMAVTLGQGPTDGDADLRATLDLFRRQPLQPVHDPRHPALHHDFMQATLDQVVGELAIAGR